MTTEETPIPVRYTISFTSTHAVDDFVSPTLWKFCQDLSEALEDYGVNPVSVVLDSDLGEHEAFTGRSLCEG